MLQLFLYAAIVGVASPVPQSQPEEVPVVEEEIVVTASLEEERRSDLPVSVTIIDSEEIRNRRAVDVAELLSTVSGLTVARSGSPGKVTSMFSRGTESNQSLVLWNGMRLNDPYFGGFDWSRLSTDGVGRVEVLRGPASMLYGSDAIGGVVQVFTDTSEGGSVRLEGGEDRYGRLGGNWGGALGQTVRLDVAGHVRQGDGAAENDFYDSDEVMARLGWRAGQEASVGLVARLARSEIGIPVASGVKTPRRRQEVESLQVALPFEADLGEWHVSASVSHLDSRFLFSDPDAVFSRSETDAERLRLRSVATYRVNETLWVAAGGDWDQEKVTDDSNFGLNLDGESRSNYSVFGQVRKDWGRLRADLGLRQDEDEFFGGETSPRLGLVFDASDLVQVFASWNEGFRAPSLGELFFPFFGNPDLEPEQSRSWEAGVRATAGNWSLDFAAFFNELDNLIDTDPVTFTAVNIGRAETRGLELGLGVRRGVVSTRVNLTLLETEDLDTGEALLRRPERSANLIVTAAPEPWSVTLVARYVGERDDLDPSTFARAVSDSYLIADIVASWKVSKTLVPYARLQNIADQNYEEVLGFPAPGRTLVVGLEVGLH